VAWFGYGLGAAITLIVNGTTPPGQSTLFLLTPALTIFAIGFATVLGAAAGVLPPGVRLGWTQSPRSGTSSDGGRPTCQPDEALQAGRRGDSRPRRRDARHTKGEFVAVVGRSGSGKTTMLDLMGLLLRPTSGSLYIDDIDTSKLGDRELARMRAHRVGFVFQEYNLLSGLNVLENVMLPLRYVKDGKSGKPRAVELIERVGLSDRIRHRPTKLSGGQAQRWAIARSMVNNPSLILLTSQPEQWTTETAQQLVDLLKRLNQEDQVTIVHHHARPRRRGTGEPSDPAQRRQGPDR